MQDYIRTNYTLTPQDQFGKQLREAGLRAMNYQTRYEAEKELRHLGNRREASLRQKIPALEHLAALDQSAFPLVLVLTDKPELGASLQANGFVKLVPVNEISESPR